MIRLAREADLESINAIYNYYVENSTCTYQYQPDTLADRKKWFFQRGQSHPVIVAESDGEILGWGALSPFSSREAYRLTVEDSIYVKHSLRKKGIGSALLSDLLTRAKTIGHHSVIARIDAEQQHSIALHRKFGFEEVGRLKEAGRKFDRWLDVALMEVLFR
jgi:phosphinothricin acetyltransferase